MAIYGDSILAPAPAFPTIGAIRQRTYEKIGVEAPARPEQGYAGTNIRDRQLATIEGAFAGMPPANAGVQGYEAGAGRPVGSPSGTRGVLSTLGQGARGVAEMAAPAFEDIRALAPLEEAARDVGGFMGERVAGVLPALIPGLGLSTAAGNIAAELGIDVPGLSRLRRTGEQAGRFVGETIMPTSPVEIALTALPAAWQAGKAVRAGLPFADVVRRGGLTALETLGPLPNLNAPLGAGQRFVSRAAEVAPAIVPELRRVAPVAAGRAAKKGIGRRPTPVDIMRTIEADLAAGQSVLPGNLTRLGVDAKTAKAISYAADRGDLRAVRGLLEAPSAPVAGRVATEAAGAVPKSTATASLARAREEEAALLAEFQRYWKSGAAGVEMREGLTKLDEAKAMGMLGTVNRLRTKIERLETAAQLEQMAAELKAAETAGAVLEPGAVQPAARAAEVLAPPPAAGAPPAAPPGGRPPTGVGGGGAELPPADPIKKLTQAIRSAKRLPAETESLRHVERQRRVAAAAKAMEQPGSATERLASGRPLLLQRGEMPRAAFEAPERVFTEAEIDTLRQRIIDAKLPLYRTFTLDTALNKVLSGQLNMLQEGELALLNRVFGPELGKAIGSKDPLAKQLGQLFIDVAGVPRTTSTAIDISAPMRQGLIPGISHPKEWKNAWRPMLKAYADEGAAQAIDDAIRSSKWSQAANEANLYFAPLDAQLTGREETMISRIFGGKINVAGRNVPNPIRASQRAYTTFLNKLRHDIFATYAEKWAAQGTDSTERLRSLAHYINASTGRGKLGPVEGAGNFLSVFFFSPRFLMGRVQTFTQLLTPTTDNAVRLLIARDLASTIAAGAGLLTLAQMSGVGEVEIDPRSSDFAKIKIGNQRVDPWGGFQQLVRYTTQMITGEAKSQRGFIYGTNRGETLLRFLLSKQSPAASMGTSILRGETMIGENIKADWSTVSREAWNRFVPMWIQDVSDALKEEGIAGAAIATTAITGVGSQTYAPHITQALAQEIYGKDYAQLSSLEIVNVNTEALARGEEISESDRIQPYYEAANDAFDYIKRRGGAGVLEALGDYSDYWKFKDAVETRIRLRAAESGKVLADSEIAAIRIKIEDALGLRDVIAASRRAVVRLDPGIVDAYKRHTGYDLAKELEEIAAGVLKAPDVLREPGEDTRDRRAMTPSNFNLASRFRRPPSSTLSPAFSFGLGARYAVQSGLVPPELFQLANVEQAAGGGWYAPSGNVIGQEALSALEAQEPEHLYVALHESLHALESNLTSNERAELEAIYARNLRPPGAPTRHHPDLLTAYFDYAFGNWQTGEPNAEDVGVRSYLPPIEIQNFVRKYAPIVAARVSVLGRGLRTRP